METFGSEPLQANTNSESASSKSVIPGFVLFTALSLSGIGIVVDQMEKSDPAYLYKKLIRKREDLIMRTDDLHHSFLEADSKIALGDNFSQDKMMRVFTPKYCDLREEGERLNFEIAKWNSGSQFPQGTGLIENVKSPLPPYRSTKSVQAVWNSLDLREARELQE